MTLYLSFDTWKTSKEKLELRNFEKKKFLKGKVRSLNMKLTISTPVFFDRGDVLNAGFEMDVTKENLPPPGSFVPSNIVKDDF